MLRFCRFWTSPTVRFLDSVGYYDKVRFPVVHLWTLSATKVTSTSRQTTSQKENEPLQAKVREVRKLTKLFQVGVIAPVRGSRF